MNPGLVVKLRPSGPWRIGPDSGARNRVDAIYHSDSLYAAVTSAMLRLGWLEEWLEATARAGEPAVRFSSCFPFQGDLGFVVPPRTLWPPASPGQSGRVRWKSARFVPLGIVQALLAGQIPEENHWTVDGVSECLVPAGQPGPFRMSVRWNAAVDRLTGTSERHSAACAEFREGAGLWTVVSFADEAAWGRWSDRVKSAFRVLADSGFGGERSRGWGRAEPPEFIEGSLPDMILPPAQPVSAVEPAPAEQVPAAEGPVAEPAVEVALEAPAAEVASELTAAELAPEAPAVGLASELTSAEITPEAPAAEVASEAQAAELAPEASGAEAAPEPPFGEAEPAEAEALVAEASLTAPALIEPLVVATPEEPRLPVEAAPAETAPEQTAPAEAAPVAEPPAPEPPAPVPPRQTAPAPRPEAQQPATPAAPQPHWLLGLFTPSAADRVDWTAGNYTVVTRGGRIDSPAASGDLKKHLTMVTEGSVLYSPAELIGGATDVAPDGFPHPVYRAGFAVSIPIGGRTA
jgi:CRISPR type III-A-associated RAMP protein Csm4